MNFPLRPNVCRMPRYVPGKPIHEARAAQREPVRVKLASNENPLGPSPFALRRIEEAAASLHHYPDASGARLKAELAQRLDLTEDSIVLGNGSDEIVSLLGHVFLGDPTDVVLVPEGSFVRYDASADLADCRLVKVPQRPTLEVDLPAMVRAMTTKTKLVMLANPNNPTGTIFRRKDFDAFLNDLPPGVLVVLDEAYFEFALGATDYPDSTEYARAGRPVFGLRTFSKAYGLAGIRIGYGFGPTEVVDAIERARSPFNVNALAQAAALGALQDDRHLARTTANNRVSRQRLVAGLSSLGFSPLPSEANFVLVDIGESCERVANALLDHGVIVRAGRALGFPNHLRISVGLPEETDRLLEALEGVLRQEVPV